MAFEITITKDYEGVSPKGYIKKMIDVPFTKVHRLIKEKRLTINGKKIKGEVKLKTGDVLKCWLDDIELRSANQTVNTEENQEAKNLGIDTIYEDQNLLILNKQAGVVVQGAQDNDTSLSLHLQYLKNKKGDIKDFNYFHVHRLDKDTSGVLVCAKNQITLRELNKIFAERKVTKKYLALCDGQFDNPEGTIEVQMERNEQGMKEKMKIVPTGGKKSVSHYKVIDQYEFKEETVTMVEIQIETGLTHQIRVHMKSIGHPIIADKMYGNNYINKVFENSLKRQFLHAQTLEFEYDGKEHKFVAPLTSDLKSLCNKLKLVK
ncbi:MAG: RluA family pseudouridine synthase [Nanoarchaeales archaeon]|nr:RluA family pseudouridine synthase [Nanoarchaeales archaeon]